LISEASLLPVKYRTGAGRRRIPVGFKNHI
jgi:hypothetical protein